MKTMIVTLVLASIAGVDCVVMDSGSPSSAGAQEPEDPRTPGIAGARRDTLTDVVRLLQAEVEVAALSHDVLSNAELLAFEAELELAKSPQEQVEILKEALRLQSEVEHDAQIRHEVGTLKTTEYLSAKAARIKAEIELHKARKRAM